MMPWEPLRKRFRLLLLLHIITALCTLTSWSEAFPGGDKEDYTCRYDSLVFSGGGVKGAVYGGALMALEEVGVLENARNFAGTSAGSMTATLLAVGYSSCELWHELSQISFDQLVEYSLPQAIKEAVFGKGTRKLLEQFDMQKGFFHGKALEELMDKLIARKLCAFNGNIRMEFIDDYELEEGGACWNWRNFTFGDLQELTRRPPYRFEHKLALTGFDITNGTLTYFSAETTPDMPISLAVRASSSLPLIFEPIEWQGHLYMDGGVLRRVPVDAFPNQGTMLAFKIGRDFIPTTPEELKEMRIGQFMYRVMHTLVRLRQDLDLVSRVKLLDGVEWINFGDEPNVSKVTGINFDVSDHTKAEMVNAGYAYIRERFQNLNCPLVRNLSCAKTSCYEHKNDRDGRQCGWIQDMYALAKERDEARELKWDIFIYSRLILSFAIVIVLSVSCTGLRNQCHHLIMHTLSYHSTERCSHCYRKWVPHELALHELKRLTDDQVLTALRVRGGKLQGSPGRRRARLRAAAYVENISLRRPWTLVQAFMPERTGTMCRDFPIKWMSILVLLLAWVFYHRNTVLVRL